jgi:hypothetical protein
MLCGGEVTPDAVPVLGQAQGGRPLLAESVTSAADAQGEYSVLVYPRAGTGYPLPETRFTLGNEHELVFPRTPEPRWCRDVRQLSLPPDVSVTSCGSLLGLRWRLPGPAPDRPLAMINADPAVGTGPFATTPPPIHVLGHEIRAGRLTLELGLTYNHWVASRCLRIAVDATRGGRAGPTSTRTVTDRLCLQLT